MLGRGAWPAGDALGLPAGVQEAVTRRLDRLEPDERWLLRLAAIMGSAVTADGLEACARAARAAGAPLIDISSLAAAGPASPRAPRSEADPSSPVNAYGRSKLEGERALQAVDGLEWTILRPGVVYGPANRALLPVFRLAQRGILPLVGRLDAAYTFVHITDLVRAIVAAVDHPAVGDTVFVGHPEPVSTRALLEGVREVVPLSF